MRGRGWVVAITVAMLGACGGRSALEVPDLADSESPDATPDVRPLEAGLDGNAAGRGRAGRPGGRALRGRRRRRRRLRRRVHATGAGRAAPRRAALDVDGHLAGADLPLAARAGDGRRPAHALQGPQLREPALDPERHGKQREADDPPCARRLLLEPARDRQRRCHAGGQPHLGAVRRPRLRTDRHVVGVRARRERRRVRRRRRRPDLEWRPRRRRRVARQREGARGANIAGHAGQQPRSVRLRAAARECRRRRRRWLPRAGRERHDLGARVRRLGWRSRGRARDGALARGHVHRAQRRLGGRHRRRRIRGRRRGRHRRHGRWLGGRLPVPGRRGRAREHAARADRAVRVRGVARRSRRERRRVRRPRRRRRLRGRRLPRRARRTLDDALARRHGRPDPGEHRPSRRRQRRRLRRSARLGREPRIHGHRRVPRPGHAVGSLAHAPRRAGIGRVDERPVPRRRDGRRRRHQRRRVRRPAHRLLHRGGVRERRHVRRRQRLARRRGGPERRSAQQHAGTRVRRRRRRRRRRPR
jgi:hypothetical protein